jgi:hypothetical protein
VVSDRFSIFGIPQQGENPARIKRENTLPKLGLMKMK